MSFSPLELINGLPVSFWELAWHRENMRIFLEFLELLLKFILSICELASLFKELLSLSINQILCFIDDHPLLLELKLHFADLVDKLLMVRWL